MQKFFATRVAKTWFCVFIIGLVFTLAACGGSTPSTASTSTPTVAPTATPTAAPTATPTPTPTTAATTAPESGSSVSIANFAFSPQSLTVKVGTKVTWTNKDSLTHTVTANGGAFNQTVPSGSTFSFTFTKAGTYSYHCAIHTSMTATIIVQ
jgi:plastocyanin